MFTLFDLQELCADEEKLRKFGEKNGFLTQSEAKCPKCDGEMGSEPVAHRGKPHWRCRRKGCQKLIPWQQGTLLDGSHLTFNDYVDPSSGVYSKRAKVAGQWRSVHTNTIDGLWGRLHCWWNHRGGVLEHQHLEVLKEFQWRQNLGTKDPFMDLVDAVKKGYFPA